MKAAPDEQKLLLDLQSFDTRLQQLARRAAKPPQAAQLADLSREEDALRRELSERTGAWEDVSAELARVETDVALVEARIARDADRLRSTSSSKDAQALEQEVASLTRRQSDLEDVQLAVMERVEQAQDALDDTRARLDGLSSRAETLRTEQDAELAGVDSERRHVQANRDTVAGRVSADLLALYEKQRARYGFGASLLRGGVTSASGVALNGSDLAAIRQAAPDDVIICPDSNAVLVRTDESGL